MLLIRKTSNISLSWFYVKQLSEPICPLITCLWGNFVKVYFGLKSIEKVIHINEKIIFRDWWVIESAYIKTVRLADKFGTGGKGSCLSGKQINCNKIPLETVQEYWEKSVSFPSFDAAFAAMKPHFSPGKRSHCEHSRLR